MLSPRQPPLVTIKDRTVGQAADKSFSWVQSVTHSPEKAPVQVPPPLGSPVLSQLYQHGRLELGSAAKIKSTTCGECPFQVVGSVCLVLQNISSVLLPFLGSERALSVPLLKRLQTISWSDIPICNSTAHLNILNHPKMPYIWAQKIRQKHIFYRFNPVTFKGYMCIKALV